MKTLKDDDKIQKITINLQRCIVNVYSFIFHFSDTVYNIIITAQTSLYSPYLSSTPCSCLLQRKMTTTTIQTTVVTINKIHTITIPATEPADNVEGVSSMTSAKKSDFEHKGINVRISMIKPH